MRKITAAQTENETEEMREEVPVYLRGRAVRNSKRPVPIRSNVTVTSTTTSTRKIAGLFGLSLWGALWFVGATATVNMVGALYKPLSESPWMFFVYGACVMLSAWEIEEMPDLKGIITGKILEPLWYIFEKKLWFLVAGLDVGSTFGGVYLFLQNKSITFFIWPVTFTGVTLIIASVFISFMCALGPEPGWRKHWQKLAGAGRGK